MLGQLRVADFLKRLHGEVRGRVVTDAKDRYYARDYAWTEEKGQVVVQRADGSGDRVALPSVIDLDEPLVAFFGLYSGDGAKGMEAPNDPTRIIPSISFSQKEPHLVRFAVDYFRKLFTGDVRFTFSLGEDSAYFMEGEGLELLRAHYAKSGAATVPAVPALNQACAKLTAADEAYLKEVRPDVPGTASEHLAFYYVHKPAMQEILTEVKRRDLDKAGLALGPADQVTASLRRPFKKGARLPGGSSRSDEIRVGGLNGIGELFLKMLHDIEETLLLDAQVSASGLVNWTDAPSKAGRFVDTKDFFLKHEYGKIAGERPTFGDPEGTYLRGQWPRSTNVLLNPSVRMTPLWCYTAGLYLAEGSTPKETLFAMYQGRPKGFSLSFTSSEGASIELVLRALRSLFAPELCLESWKIKVGSQYFPELVVTGLKHGVPMLRGGNSGDGKLRTMEISLAVRSWALGVADAPLNQASLLCEFYADRFTHVEPTGAGVARIDFSASSALCRWYFPLLMFSVFSSFIDKPAEGFY